MKTLKQLQADLKKLEDQRSSTQIEIQKIEAQILALKTPDTKEFVGEYFKVTESEPSYSYTRYIYVTGVTKSYTDQGWSLTGPGWTCWLSDRSTGKVHFSTDENQYIELDNSKIILEKLTKEEFYDSRERWLRMVSEMIYAEV